MIKDIIIDYNNLVQSRKIVIVYFYNCECIKTNDIYTSLTKKNNVLFLSYDVEDSKNTKLIEKLDLKIYPYFYIYKNGEMIDQILGTLNINKILSQYVYT
jgi:hypothetical protein